MFVLRVLVNSLFLTVVIDVAITAGTLFLAPFVTKELVLMVASLFSIALNDSQAYGFIIVLSYFGVVLNYPRIIRLVTEENS